MHLFLLRTAFFCLCAHGLLAHPASADAHVATSTTRDSVGGVQSTDQAATDPPPPTWEDDRLVDWFARAWVFTPMQVAPYVPFVQHLGIRLDAFGLLRSCLSYKEYRRCEGGLDVHFRKDLQLSLDVGRARVCPNQALHGNAGRYQTQGNYGSAALRYVGTPNPRTKAYVGLLYGTSHFQLAVVQTDLLASPSVQKKAHFAGGILGSELKLFPKTSLYGGTALRIVRRMSDLAPSLQGLSNYVIPGYGCAANRVNCTLSAYIKWDFSFLEKRLVIE